MKKSLFAVLVIAACLLLAAACASSKAADSTGSPTHSLKPTMKVSLEPSGNSVTVHVETDLHISPEHYGQARKDGEGHIHMYLDGGEKVGVKEDKHEFTDLKPGKHTLKVSLHNNDHTPYDVTQVLDFEIK